MDDNIVDPNSVGLVVRPMGHESSRTLLNENEANYLNHNNGRPASHKPHPNNKKNKDLEQKGQSELVDQEVTVPPTKQSMTINKSIPTNHS